jgi:hypothetical protein
MGNILTIFWLATTKKKVAKEMLQKNMQKVNGFERSNVAVAKG